MSSEKESNLSRVQQLAAEYMKLRFYYDEAMKEKDEEKMKLMQEEKNKLLAEIHEIDPDFKEDFNPENIQEHE